MCRIAIAAAVVFLSAAGAWAAPEEDRERIEAIERALKTEKDRSQALDRKARNLDKEARALSRRLVTVAKELRTLERRQVALGTRLEVIADLQQGKLSALERQHLRLSRLLTSLQRIARNPPEAVLAYAQTPQDVLRSAMLLRSVLPKLEGQAETLRKELEEIRVLHKDAAKRKAALDATAAKLATKRKELDQLLERKRKMARTTHAEHRRAEERSIQLAAQAQTLRGLLERIEQDRKVALPSNEAISPPEDPLASPGSSAPRPPQPPQRNAERPASAAPEQQLAKIHPPKPPARPQRTESQTQLALAPALRMSRARGRLIPPVVGRIVARFGAKRAIGTRVKGISFATPGGAQVIAPHRGEVVFAGQFRGYGRLLIIDHGEGYHTLLAGLGRIDVALNQQLLSGEPVGIMAPSGKGPPRLYLELRRNGRPFDPLPWLAASSTDKVSG